jgi:RNA polymerase sigma-70 factor (ECF subfamily)
MSNWLSRLQSAEPGYEADVVERYTLRLMALARRQLPERVRRRVDPEDVVQSVYRSFFRRLNDGQFNFDDSHDIWRLLAAMTYHKANKAVRFHQQQRRDARRDTRLTDASRSGTPTPADPAPTADDLATLYDFLEQITARLPEHHRAILLFRLEGYSIEEIGHRVNRSQGTVLRVLARVRVLAEKLLEETG